MPWAYSLEYSPTHSFTNYVLNAKVNCLGFVYDYSRLLLQPTNEYQQLDLVEVYKVYKDKFDRLHYFILSGEQTIIELTEQLNLGESNIKFVTDINITYHRVVQLTFNHTYVYCLPQVNTVIRRRLHA